VSVSLADLGLAKLLTGEPEMALSFLERSLAEQPNNVRAWQRKTVALHRSGGPSPLSTRTGRSTYRCFVCQYWWLATADF
jgi:hypothetical protein